MIRVYKFGARVPDKEHLVRGQMRLANRYYNDLIAIERDRRSALRALVDSATAAEIALVRANWTDDTAWDTLRKARAASLRDIKDERTRLSEVASDQSKLASKNSGVFWTTKSLVEASIESAKKVWSDVLEKMISRPLWDRLDGDDPRFHRGAGEGRVGVHKLAQVPFTMGPMAPTVGGSKRSERRVFTWVEFAVGLDREIVRWPVLAHRPIPDGSTIKTAVVQLYKVGPREAWELILTVDEPDSTRAKPASAHGSVAMDIGWRKFDKEIRVGSWVGDDGRKGEARVTERILSGLERAATLRSTRDVLFNRHRALASVLWPEVAQWKSAGRLAARVLAEPTPVDAVLPNRLSLLQAWQHYDRHLWVWEREQHARITASREDSYRNVAAGLAKRYETLVLEKGLRLSELALVESTDNSNARSNRHAVGPGEFRAALVNAFGEARIRYAEMAFTTTACNVCGDAAKWDQAKNVEHTCKNRHTWDQDENAARNLLKGEYTQAEVQSKRETKWSKIRGKKQAPATNLPNGSAAP